MILSFNVHYVTKNITVYLNQTPTTNPHADASPEDHLIVWVNGGTEMKAIIRALSLAKVKQYYCNLLRKYKSTQDKDLKDNVFLLTHAWETSRIGDQWVTLRLVIRMTKDVMLYSHPTTRNPFTSLQMLRAIIWRVKVRGRIRVVKCGWILSEVFASAFLYGTPC